MKSKNVLNKVVNVCGKVVGKKQETLSELYDCRVVRKARMIVYNSSHVHFQYYNNLSSGSRVRAPKRKTDRSRQSYIAIHATLTARDFLLISTLPVHSHAFFPKPLLIFLLCWLWLPHGSCVIPHNKIGHLDHNDLWHTFQSAYRPKHSTETALLRVLNDLTASNSGFISILTLLDLSAAFDTIDHSIILPRLDSTFGIRDLALSFFRSYLQDRTQVVTVNGIKSSPSLLTCGVPQSSVLGPIILFILYTQPLSDVISHHSVSSYVCG